METTLSDAEKAELTAKGNIVRVREIELTPAQVLTLNSVPPEVAGNPGDGYVIEFMSAVFVLDFESIAYATNGNLSIRSRVTHTPLSDVMALADFLDGTADDVRVMQALSADTQLDPGEGLELFCATGDPTAGDSPVRVKVKYSVYATGL